MAVSLVLAAALSSCSGGIEGAGDSAGKTDVFGVSVLPLLQADCSGANCHSPGGSGAAFLSVSASSSQTYQSVKNLVKPGSSAASPIISSMGADYASTSTWNALRAWIDAGAVQFGASGDIVSPTPPAYAGVNVCADYCHYRQATAWLASPHGNDESISPSHVRYDAGLLNSGFPAVADLSAADCAYRCHDPLSDGRENLTVGYTGDRPRPVIGCESCHGAGGGHFGAPGIRVPYPEPDAARCGQCHNESLAEFGRHEEYHPEAIDIKADYLASPHAASVNEHVLAGESGDVRAACSRCHTDEGARALAWVAPTYSGVNAQIPYASPPLADSSRVECRTCHRIHDEGKLWIPGDSAGSSEYNTCVNCHAAARAFHGPDSSYSWKRVGGAESTEFTFNASRIIDDTHGSDDPSTPAIIEGYVIRAKSERACRDCHNVHSADNAKARQWAGSGHGGGLGEAKKLAEALTVTVTDPAKTPDKEGIVPPVLKAGSVGIGTGGPGEVVATWAHYDWDAANRQACQKCHTPTGLVNYLSSGTKAGGVFTFDPTLYNPAKNDFTHLAGWTGTKADDGSFSGITSSGQNEMLYCWGCHSDNRGGVRNPGKVAPNFDRWNADGTLTPPAYLEGGNLGLSNVCAASCHSGRGNGGNVTSIFSIGGALAASVATSAKPANYPAKVFPAAGPAAFTPTQTHYMNAGATIRHALLKPGYEYPGLSYANKPHYAHDFASKLAEDPESGGPCLSCHMAEGSHTLSPFDAKSGEPVPACSVEGCHVGQYAITRADVEEEEEAFEEARDLLKAELKTRGVLYKKESYPYVFEVYLPEAPSGKGGQELPGAVQFRKWTDWTAWPAGSETAQPVNYSSVDLGPDPKDAAKNLYAFTYGPSNADEGFAGAAHNLSYLSGEPGAFAHDSAYAKRLLFDSIHYMRNHAPPGEGATLDLAAHPKVAEWFAPGTQTPGAVGRP